MLFTDGEETDKIELNYDGQNVRGFYEIRHRQGQWELRVYRNNRSVSVQLADIADHQQLATKMFEHLVQETWIPLEKINTNLPPAIRQVAFLYANQVENEKSDDPDYSMEDALIESFGEQSVGSLAHQQVAWLCLNALQWAIPAWVACCDHPIAADIFDQLLRHVCDGVEISNWDELCHPPIPTRDGAPIQDCEAAMLEPIATGLAEIAQYLRNGDPYVAVEVLGDAWCAQDEGAWSSKSLPFHSWLAVVALPAAFNCRGVDIDEDLNLPQKPENFSMWFSRIFNKIFL